MISARRRQHVTTQIGGSSLTGQVVWCALTANGERRSLVGRSEAAEGDFRSRRACRRSRRDPVRNSFAAKKAIPSAACVIKASSAAIRTTSSSWPCRWAAPCSRSRRRFHPCVCMCTSNDRLASISTRHGPFAVAPDPGRIWSSRSLASGSLATSEPRRRTAVLKPHGLTPHTRPQNRIQLA